MNWRLITWFAGVMLTLGGLKFVWVFLKTLLSKETMEDCIDSLKDSVSGAAGKLSNKIKMKAERRREKKEQNRPVITIR